LFYSFFQYLAKKNQSMCEKSKHREISLYNLSPYLSIAMPNVTTLKELAEVIEKLLAIEKKEALRAAFLILSVIGFEDSMLDNTLDSKRRKLLTMLSRYGIFYVDLQVVSLPVEKREWRVVRWVFDRKALRNIAKHLEAEKEAVQEDIYANDEIWEQVF